MHNLSLRRIEQREPADDVVRASREASERRDRGLLRGRLSEDLAVERDDGVDAEDPLPGTLLGARRGLAQRVRSRDVDGVAGRDLLDVDVDDLESDRELLEDRPPLRRAAGEDERRALAAQRPYSCGK